MSNDVCERDLSSCLPERVVQAIRGFLLGFRRGDSVTSKTRAIGKSKCVVFLLEIPVESACERKIEIVFLCFAY